MYNFILLFWKSSELTKLIEYYALLQLELKMTEILVLWIPFSMKQINPW